MARRFLITVLPSLAVLTACSPSAVVQLTPTLQEMSQATTAASPTATPEPLIIPEVVTTIPVPAGDSRVASQRELLFARLDLGGAGATLQPAEPIISPAEFGAIEAYAFEQADPYVYHAFYLFESDATLSPAFTRWVMDNEVAAYLPEGAELIAGSGSGSIAISYYFPDGSRGDPQAAEDALYDVLGRVGGNE